MLRVIHSTNTVKRQKAVKAAEEREDTRIEDTASALKDDFDYVMESFDKLARSGQVDEALGIMSNLSIAINDAIQETNSKISQ